MFDWFIGGPDQLSDLDDYNVSTGDGEEDSDYIANMLGESKVVVGGNEGIEVGGDDKGDDESNNGVVGAYAENEDKNAAVRSIGAEVDGDTVVISFVTRETNPWDHNYSKNNITITFADGTTKTITIDYNGNIHGDNWSDINGASIEQLLGTDDTGTSTIRIPSSWLDGRTDFTISSGSLSAEMKEGGSAIVSGSNGESGNSEAVYTGISVDGDFSDWDAVQKTDLLEPDGEKCVESVAWRIEGDAVYLYIKDSGTNSATWAGPNHNGKFAITTDLGRTLVLQLNEDGMVTGVDGIESVHNGSQWEIRIPSELLPQNNGGLNFGLYLTDPTLSGYGDVGNTESGTGIAYDGVYGDWDNYPHSEIQYATAGTQENVPDGEAAIYMDNNIYGHCVTEMPAHLDERGQEFTEGVTVSVNRRVDDIYGWYQEDLHMRLAAVDANGNINWNPQRSGLDNGSYEYYIFDTGCWGSSQNINDLVEADVCYGKATIQILDGRQDMEWYVDPAKLAARYQIEETDIKTVSSQYIRIGTQLVSTAGTSSGPIPGAAMCLASAAIPFLKKKKFSLGTLQGA